MTSAYIFIAAILILGGIIAALGDRLGSKIGKKRLRLFNLRPRQTAILVTIVTGISISASSLLLLFGLSKSLRQGVFELDTLLNERRDAIKELEENLERARKEKALIEKQLNQAKREQNSVQKRLKEINQNYRKSRIRFNQVSNQLNNLRSDIQTLLKERQQLSEQRNKLATQIQDLQGQIQARDQELSQQEQQLREQNQRLTQQDQILNEKQARLQELEKEQEQLQTEIQQRDQKISQLDKTIADKDQNIALKAQNLNELEEQLSFLKREVEVLEQYYQTYQELRESRIALVKGQVLSMGAFRLDNPEQTAVINVVDKLLREANLFVIKATRPDSNDPDERVVKITKAQVEQLIEQLQTNGEYVVRILSAGNYVLGEKEVRVFADVVPNQKIFNQGQQIAAVSVDPNNLSEEEIQKRLDILLSAAQFRARRQGILGNIAIEDGSLKTITNFIEKVSKSPEPLDEIQVLAADNTYTIGPLRLRLVAVRDGKIIFST